MELGEATDPLTVVEARSGGTHKPEKSVAARSAKTVTHKTQKSVFAGRRLLFERGARRLRLKQFDFYQGKGGAVREERIRST